MDSLAALAGRILIALIFLQSGIDKFVALRSGRSAT